MKTVDGENMEKHKLEQISALMDEQLDEKEQEMALDSLLSDIEAQKMWQEYHLIRDCLQNHQTKLGFDVKKSLIERLKQEAILFVPKVSSKGSHWRGFAVAASVAAVTIAVWQAWPNMQNKDASLMATTVQMQNVAANDPQSSGSSVPTLAIATTNEPVHVNSYLRAHQEAMGDGLVHASLQEGTQ